MPKPSSDVSVGPGPRPFYKDPYVLTGLVVAFLAAGAYYYVFVRKPVIPVVEVARFTALEGRVRVKARGQEVWMAAKDSVPLRTGDIVQTEAKSAAEITFFSGNVVRVRPESVVYIGESAAASTAAWRLQSGKVNFEAQQRTEISTPTVRTTAANKAAGNIDVGDAGDTGVKIFKGSAQVATRQGATVTLNENEAVQVDALGRAGPKLNLPGPPTLVSPEPRAEIPYSAPPEPTTRLVWNPVPAAQSYRVAMDFNVIQANLLLSAALDKPGITDTSEPLEGLDPGKYFWRVAAVSKEGLEGAFSKVTFFSVVKPLAPSPTPPVSGPLSLTVEPVEVLAGALQVKGRTDPGATVTVDGYPIRVLADGSFSEFIKRTERTVVVVRATGPDGQVAEQTRAVAAN